MELSKHNIISKIAGSDKYFIVNLLSQQADILLPNEAERLLGFTGEIPAEFFEKGYVVDTQEEQKLFKARYLEFIDHRDTDEIQIFYVPSYACNFACSYCYQDEYLNIERPFDKNVVDAFFEFISTRFSRRRKYITIFGGEPLLKSQNQIAFFDYFVQCANQLMTDLAIVTNGYFIKEYIDILKKARIREIQVTLDGTNEFHNRRRMLKGGQPTFDKIVEGIDELLVQHIPVNLRMVLDKENIEGLPELARFAIDRGWTKSGHFKTQLGRNYELHHCQSASSRLYSRIEMYSDIFSLLKEHPFIEEFHKPAFSVSKFLFEEGKLPDPLFDSCPGAKTEWAFDYTGKIYSCTATVGKQYEELGTFYPLVELDEEQVCDWQSRDILTIAECRNCALQLACGGGCASVAKNATGSINTPDCRPVKELLELGIAHYFADMA
ncbi:MAG: radical SAM protein [Bacteroidales bacterium]|nr:radical SAM protein [Bacteroidales bacterium]